MIEDLIDQLRSSPEVVYSLILTRDDTDDSIKAFVGQFTNKPGELLTVLRTIYTEYNKMMLRQDFTAFGIVSTEHESGR